MEKECGLRDAFLGSVTVGERGQVVIPAEARERIGIEPGEKLLAFIHPGGWGISFLKVDAVLEHANSFSQIAESVREGREGQ